MRAGHLNAPRDRGRLTFKPFDRNFRLYLLALVAFTLGNSSDAFLLLRAGEVGVPTALLPLLWCAFHVVKSGGNLLAGRAVDTLGPRPLIVTGWIVYAAIYLAFLDDSQMEPIAGQHHHEELRHQWIDHLAGNIVQQARRAEKLDVTRESPEGDCGGRLRNHSVKYAGVVHRC